MKEFCESILHKMSFPKIYIHVNWPYNLFKLNILCWPGFVRNINHFCCPFMYTHLVRWSFSSLLLDFLSFVRYKSMFYFVHLIILLILGFIYFGTGLNVRDILSKSVSIKWIQHPKDTHSVVFVLLLVQTIRFQPFGLENIFRLSYEKLNVKWPK